MTRDLEAALREVRASLSECGEAYSVAIIQHCIARIDAALSAASGEAKGERLRQCDCCGQMKDRTSSTVAYGMDTTVCEDCSSRPAPNPAGLSRKSREILNGDAYETASGGARENSVIPCYRGGYNCSWPACSADCDGRPGRLRPAPSEAPNVDLDRIAELEAKISGLESLRPVWAYGFSSADVAAQVTGVALASLWARLSADNQTKAVLALDALYARIAELEKELDSARAEGIAAMRECAAKIARNGCLVPPDGGSPTESERLMCEGIAAAIREAKP